MQAFNQYKALVKAMFKNSLSANFIKKNKQQKKGSKIASKSLYILGIALGVVGLLFLLVSQTFSMTISAIMTGTIEQLIYMYLFATQILVILMGSIITLDVIFFSKDNTLLATLPIKSSTIFVSKFTVAYINQLLISSFFCFPALTTIGVTCAVTGVGLGVQFYIIGVLAIPLMPILPILIINLLSLPFMWIASHTKNPGASRNIIMFLVSLSGFLFYILFVSSGSFVSGENGEIGAIVNITSIFAKYGIHNYLLVNALMGVKSVLYFFLHILSLVVAFLIAFLLSKIFYKKSLTIVKEEKPTNKKTYKTLGLEDYKLKKPLYSFIYKEIKNILRTPALLMNSLMMLIILPIILIFSTKMGFGGEVGNISQLDFQKIGFGCYLIFLCSVSANVLAMSAISVEGKHFAMLKSFPINIKAYINSKIITANILSAVQVIVGCLTIFFLSESKNILLLLLNIIMMMLGCVGISAIGMKNDLKKPNFKFTNISELTKNNTRALKPVLLCVGIGLVYMILGFVFALTPMETLKLSMLEMYLIFYAVMIIINVVVFYVGIMILKHNFEDLYNGIEV